MILSLIASPRFPAPEFENYTLPQMTLEHSLPHTIYLRLGLLLLFLVLAGLAFHRFRSRKATVAVTFGALIIFGYAFNACPCPVGLFQNIADSAMNGLKMPVELLLLFAIPLACALFFGRLFCSGGCPLGAVQEIVHWKTTYVPLPIDYVLRMIPVLLLIVFSVMAASGALYPLCWFDPYLPLFLFSFKMPFALLTLGFLVLGLFISRPFCRYICPYGALLRFFAIFSATKPLITTRECINCRLCEQGCPNGAILTPEDKETTESRSSGTRRMSLLIASIPVALLLGGLIGHISAPLITSIHPDVILLSQLRSGTVNDETTSFRSSETPISDLETKVLRAEVITTAGLGLGGMLFGAFFMAELISRARRKSSEETYEIDSSLCFCCGRCYEACPLEKE